MNFTAPTKTQVLEAISDDINFSIFEIIRNNTVNTERIRDGLELTVKQCYDRVGKLTNAGLVNRKNGYYKLTAFGHLVFQAQSKVAKGVQNISKLKMVDEIRGDGVSKFIPKDEIKKLVEEIIDDDELNSLIGNGE